MAYFGNYGGYAPPQHHQQQQQYQQAQQQQQQQQQQQTPPQYQSQAGISSQGGGGGGGSNAYASTGLASYGGAYKVNQPAYYAGPSYSTTSDNDFLNSLPIAGYGAQVPYSSQSGYGGGGGGQNGHQLGSYAGNSYMQEQYICQQISYGTPQPVSAAPVGSNRSYSQHQYSSYSQAQLPSSSAVAADQTADLSQLAPQIEAAYEAATGQQRRQPVIKRQVITIPGAPGRVQQIVRRLPTPTPDIIERVFIVKPQRDVVNLIIERPGTPPAQYKDRTIMGKPRKPLINPMIVRVAARSQLQYQATGYASNQQQYQQMPALNLQRVAPSSSYHQYQHQHGVGATPVQPLQQDSSQGHLSPQPQQPALSSQQYSQARLSQHALSQASQSQLQPQPFSKSQLQKGFVIAPIQYEDYLAQQQQQQQQAAASGQAAPGSPNMIQATIQSNVPAQVITNGVSSAVSYPAAAGSAQMSVAPQPQPTLSYGSAGYGSAPLSMPCAPSGAPIPYNPYPAQPNYGYPASFASSPYGGYGQMSYPYRPY